MKAVKFFVNPPPELDNYGYYTGVQPWCIRDSWLKFFNLIFDSFLVQFCVVRENYIRQQKLRTTHFSGIGSDFLKTH